MKKYKNIKFLCVAAFALTASQNTFAEGFSGMPAGWKLESYGTSSVVLWNTPSTCSGGVVTLPGEATVTDHNRLYATVMAAKVAKAEMFIYYEQVGANCIIKSFGFI